MARESPAPHRGRHLGPFELGDLPSWLALVGVIAALVFSGYESYQSRQQLRLSEEQSEQKQAQPVVAVLCFRGSPGRSAPRRNAGMSAGPPRAPGLA
jgi:hypothetical protein